MPVVAALLFALSFSAAPAPVGALSFAPPDPRLGDLLLVYVDDPRRDAPNLGRLEAFGHKTSLVRVGRTRWRGAIAVPTDVAPGRHAVRVGLGGVWRDAELEVAPRTFDSSELSVNRRFTDPPSRALRRRQAREREQLERLWKKAPTRAKAHGPLRRPVAGEVTAVFGTQRVFNGKTESVHYGLDLDGRVGDPVTAVAAGRVVLSDMRWASGGTVIVDHGGGLFSLYFHLSERKVRVGSWLAAGERLGRVGKTGRVTGPHLHLALVVRGEPLEGGGAPRSLYVDPERALGLSLDGEVEHLEAPRPVRARTRR
jgi:murein DD-endopeptidase MepM/ murein hydrolase activator NlpD